MPLAWKLLVKVSLLLLRVNPSALARLVILRVDNLLTPPSRPLSPLHRPPLHRLPFVVAGNGNIVELTTAILQMATDIRGQGAQLQAIDAQLHANDTPQSSFTGGERGRTAIESLKQYNSDTNLNASDGVGDPIMTADEAKEAKNITSERELVRFVTPFLERVLDGTGRVVVNSEELKWLWSLDYLVSGMGTALKPDLFTCPIAMYSSRQPGDSITEGRDGRFGVIEFRELRQFVVVMEAKCKIDSRAISEIIVYLERMSHKSESGPISRGVLFDVNGFQLMMTNGSVLVSRKYGNWDVAGGKELLRDFLSPFEDLECGLIRACAGMHVELDEPDSYLGKGGTGFAFRGSMSVDGGERRKIAIKIALDNYVVMDAQVTRMQSDAVIRATNVMRVVGKIWVDCASILKGKKVSAYVLESAGKRVEEGRDAEIFSSLQLLHSFGVVHGDARRPNVVDVDTKLKWIDLPPRIDEETNYRWDVTDLIVSVFKVKAIDVLGLQTEIDMYEDDMSPEKMDAVYRKCQELFPN
jgi:hypothetical protein